MESLKSHEHNLFSYESDNCLFIIQLTNIKNITYNVPLQKYKRHLFGSIFSNLTSSLKRILNLIRILFYVTTGTFFSLLILRHNPTGFRQREKQTSKITFVAKFKNLWIAEWIAIHTSVHSQSHSSIPKNLQSWRYIFFCR